MRKIPLAAWRSASRPRIWPRSMPSVRSTPRLFRGAPPGAPHAPVAAPRQRRGGGVAERQPGIRAGDPDPLPPPPALNGPVTLVDYDPAWPTRYEALAARVRHALGGRVLALHHAGSTSVPGLAAKPIIDMVLEVADSADERSYVSALRAAGFSLRIREPGWFEHRLCRGAPPSNLHVFSAGCEEVRRMLAFRDHLRRDGADRA